MTKIDLENWYKSLCKNFVTPNIIKYHLDLNNDRVIELSKGRGMANQMIYGVSILSYDPQPLIKDKSMFFNEDKDSATKYYNSLISPRQV